MIQYESTAKLVGYYQIYKEKGSPEWIRGLNWSREEILEELERREIDRELLEERT